MKAAVKNYFDELGSAVGQGWNRFWFIPTAATTLGLVRVATGLMSFYAVYTYAPDLERWFSPAGMMPKTMIEGLYVGQWSMFDYLPTYALWPAYWASLAVLALYALGIGGRIICILAAAVTLSFFGRTPLVTGEFETILAILLVYLCVGRSCDAFSVTAWRRQQALQPPASSLQPASPANTIALRLLQIHFAAVHLMMGCAQLNAPEGAWWTGEGIWLAATRPGMALVDFSFLTDHPRVVAAWSHVITLYLLTFAVFIWLRLARPIVLAVGVFVWVSFALASGWIMFSLAMLTGLLAYVEPEQLAALAAPRVTEPAPSPAARSR